MTHPSPFIHALVGATAVAVLAAATLAAPARAAAQAVVGQVTDHLSGEPLWNVNLRLVDADGQSHASTFSANNGRFLLVAPAPGTWRITAEVLGYGDVAGEPLELAENQTVAVEIRMAVTPIVLDDPIVVTAQRTYVNADIEGFHRRRVEGSGNGTFIHGDAVRRRLGSRPTDLVRTIPGLTLMRAPRGQDQIIHMRNGCIPAIFIDGMQINRYSPNESIDTYLDVQSIEGIEVYRGSQPAGRFFDRRGCGLVIIWTRRGEVEPGGSFSLVRLAVAIGIFAALISMR